MERKEERKRGNDSMEMQYGKHAQPNKGIDEKGFDKYWEEQHMREVKEVSEFFGIYVPNLFSIHLIDDNGKLIRYEIDTFINGREVKLILPKDNFSSDDLLHDDKSSEGYSACIMCAWVSIKLIKDNKLSDLEAKSKCEIFENAFEDMNDTHKDLLKPLNESFLKFIKRG
jgi:hypothetical protein|nr:MAG TPA: hypothetical protein [Caudoviricetes sp.]